MDIQPDRKFVYVDTESGLKGLLKRIEKCDNIAIDTEADSLYHYYHKVCLIQLTVGGDNFIVDPLAKMDLNPFFGAVSQKPLILHDAGYDLRMMRLSFGFVAKNRVFDTMLAARLLGREHFGLGSLVEEFFGVVMPKGGQKSDWSRRPLSAKQLEYASEDTFYLHKLADIFDEELKKLGRKTWHDEWCRRIIDSIDDYKQPKDLEDAWRIKGARFLSPEALAQLRQIWQWRELESQKEDTPPFKIMANALLLRLSVWAAIHGHKKISAGPKLPRTCRGRRLEELKKAIAIAYNMDASQRPGQLKPKHRPKPAPQVSMIYDELKDECDRIAGELLVAPQVISPRAVLKTIAIKRPETAEEIVIKAGTMKWQANLLEPSVKQILNQYTRKT